MWRKLSSVKGDSTMTLDEMKAFIKRHDEDVINRQDLSVLVKDISPNYVDHSALPGFPAGMAGAKAMLSMIHGAFPDLQATIEDAIAEGDKVVVRKSWTGTHEGEFMGIPPTGKRVSFEGIVIWRIKGSQIAERWAAIDRLGLMEQLGAIRQPAAQGARHA
jgi:predicted ester cyclase